MFLFCHWLTLLCSVLIYPLIITSTSDVVDTVSSEVSSDGSTTSLNHNNDEEEVWRGGRCCVCELGLITQHITHSTILDYHNKSCPPTTTTKTTTDPTNPTDSTSPTSITTSSPPPRKITLGFVTPWNEQGYDLSEKYGRDRLTHVSPVWFQIRWVKGSGITVIGSHWKHSDWIRSMQKQGVRVVPRITIDPTGWDHHQLHRLLTKKKNHKRLVSRMSAMINAGAFDGVVFELTPLFNFLITQSNAARDPNTPGITNNDVMRSKSRLDALLKRLSRHFSLRPRKQTKINDDTDTDNSDSSDGIGGKSNHDFLLAITPAHLTLVNYEEYGEWITGVALMTYDYSLHNRQTSLKDDSADSDDSGNEGFKGGPNSPLKSFLEPYVTRSMLMDYVKFNPSVKNDLYKFLLGFNFYGYRFQPAIDKEGMLQAEPVIGSNDVIDKIVDQSDEIRQDWQWKWNDEHSEHVIINRNGSHHIWFPSLLSIDLRLRFAQRMGLGVSIWELGQGLEYFFQLL